MEIIHQLDKLFYSLFPNIKPNDSKSIQQELSRYYSTPFFQPEVTIENNEVKIHINTNQLESLAKDYKKAIALCESRNFEDAKLLLSSLIEKNPTNSEFYRIFGQIYSEEGDQESAINYLIESLKWNNKNTYALTMMGNIYFKYKEDADTALIYFNQVLKINPNDHLALNNIGSQLGKMDRLDEAKDYLNRALESNPKFPNTYFGLALISDKSGNLQEAFNLYLIALQFCDKKDDIYKNILRNILELCNRIVESDIGDTIINQYKTMLESRCGIPINIETSNDVPYYAKIEYAEIYDRDSHIIKYKPNKPGVSHLIMHELTHLKFALDSKENNNYQLIVTNEENKSAFYEFANSSILKLRSRGIPETDISNFISAIQDGIISQLFNTPIDLFIEDFLFSTYEQLRPYQFISLYNLMKESIQAVTDPKILEVASEHIVSKSKIYNLVNAFQFRDLFNIDLEDDFNADPKERKLAKSFYKEFLRHKDNKSPGIEYELIANWSQKLDLDRFFQLANETDYLKRKKLEHSFHEDEINEATTSSNISIEDTEMAKFLRNQELIGLNKAIVFYMIGALEYFKETPIHKIKDIAMEIARIGMNGISPVKDGYKVSLIPDKSFSGNQLLAYYYVSWKLAIPEMVDKLQLPFRDEYEMAEKMFGGRK